MSNEKYSFKKTILYLSRQLLFIKQQFLTSCVTSKVWLRALVISSLLTTAFLWHAPACSLVYEKNYLSVKAVVISFVLVKMDIAKQEKQ